MVIKTIEPKIEKFKIENGSLGRSETSQNIYPGSIFTTQEQPTTMVIKTIEPIEPKIEKFNSMRSQPVKGLGPPVAPSSETPQNIQNLRIYFYNRNQPCYQNDWPPHLRR